MIAFPPLSSREPTSAPGAAPSPAPALSGANDSTGAETLDFQSALTSATVEAAPAGSEGALPATEPAPPPRRDEPHAEIEPEHGRAAPHEDREAQELPGTGGESTRKSDPPSRPVPRSPDVLLKGPVKGRGHALPPGDQSGAAPPVDQPALADAALPAIDLALDAEGKAVAPPGHPSPAPLPVSAPLPDVGAETASVIDAPAIRRAAPRAPDRATGGGDTPRDAHARAAMPETAAPRITDGRSEETRPIERLQSPSQPEPAPAPATQAAPTGSQSGPPSPATFLELQPQAGARVAPQAAAGSAPASLPTPPPPSTLTAPPEEGQGAQVVRGALALTRTTGGAMTIRLEPESLGSLRIQMHVAQGRVSVQFHAETAQARGLLTHHIDALRTAMESQGLKLDTVQIHSLHRAGPSSGSSEQPHSQHQPSSGEQGSRQDSAGQQSRGHGDTAEREAQYRQMARQALHQAREGASWRQHWNAASVNAPTEIAKPQAADSRLGSPLRF